MKTVKFSKNTLLRHALIWLCLILYVTFFNFVVGSPISKFFYVPIFIGNFIIAYYVLLNIVFPNFFEKNKIQFVLFYLFVVCLFVTIDYIHLKKVLPFLGGHTPRGDLPLYNFINRSILLFSYVAFTSAGWYLNFRSIQRDQEKSEREKNIISRELNFLKNQFNSHLTFNFLSFCYGKMLIYSPKEAKSIENFSEMLHYSFNHKLSEYVSLTNEIQYIENFIEVQKCLTSSVCVKFNYTGDVSKCDILPMLLGIFVENSFKHGVVNDSKNPILIALAVENNEILFRIENTRTNSKNKISTGIGLQNAKKILSLFYENRHSLKINEENNTYSCELNLKLENTL